MWVKYIFATLGALFTLLAVAQAVRKGEGVSPARRTWLIVGAIFSLVAVWLWTR